MCGAILSPARLPIPPLAHLCPGDLWFRADGVYSYDYIRRRAVLRPRHARGNKNTRIHEAEQVQSLAGRVEPIRSRLEPSSASDTDFPAGAIGPRVSEQPQIRAGRRHGRPHAGTQECVSLSDMILDRAAEEGGSFSEADCFGQVGKVV